MHARYIGRCDNIFMKPFAGGRRRLRQCCLFEGGAQQQPGALGVCWRLLRRAER